MWRLASSNPVRPVSQCRGEIYRDGDRFNIQRGARDIDAQRSVESGPTTTMACRE